MPNRSTGGMAGVESSQKVWSRSAGHTEQPKKKKMKNGFVLPEVTAGAAASICMRVIYLK